MRPFLFLLAGVTACGKPDATSTSYRSDDSSAVLVGAIQDTQAAFAADGATAAETTALEAALAAAGAAIAREPATELSSHARSGRALYAVNAAAGMAILASIPPPVLTVLSASLGTPAALRAAAEEALKLEETVTSLRAPLDTALTGAVGVSDDDDARKVIARVDAVWDALATWLAQRMASVLHRNGDTLSRLLAVEELREDAVRGLLRGQQLAAAALPAYARDFFATQTARMDASRAFDSTIDSGLAKLLGGYTEDSVAVEQENEHARATRAYLAQVAPAEPPPAAAIVGERPLPEDAFARLAFVVALRLAELTAAQVATATDLSLAHRDGPLAGYLADEPEAALQVARARVAALTTGTSPTGLQQRTCSDELSGFDPRGAGVTMDSIYFAAIGAETAAVCAHAPELGTCGARLTEILCDELASCHDRLLAFTRAADAVAAGEARSGVVLMSTLHAFRLGCRELPLDLVIATLR